MISYPCIFPTNFHPNISQSFTKPKTIELPGKKCILALQLRHCFHSIPSTLPHRLHVWLTPLTDSGKNIKLSRQEEGTEPLEKCYRLHGCDTSESRSLNVCCFFLHRFCARTAFKVCCAAQICSRFRVMQLLECKEHKQEWILPNHAGWMQFWALQCVEHDHEHKVVRSLSAVIIDLAKQWQDKEAISKARTRLNWLFQALWKIFLLSTENFFIFKWIEFRKGKKKWKNRQTTEKPFERFNSLLWLTIVCTTKKVRCLDFLRLFFVWLETLFPGSQFFFYNSFWF